MAVKKKGSAGGTPSGGKKAGGATSGSSTGRNLAAAAAFGAVLCLGATWYFRDRVTQPATTEAPTVKSQSTASEVDAKPVVKLPELVPADLWVPVGKVLDASPLRKEVTCLRTKNNAEANKCMPIEGCSRHVFDDVASADEVKVLKDMIEWLIEEAWGGGLGPPSVVDLHQGSISYKDNFVMLRKLMDFKEVHFSAEQISTYNAVRDRMRERALELFNAPQLLPEMTFFSHINSSKSAHNMHDEYWHPHIDTEQYGTFAVTTILYLNAQGADYDGGGFRFADNAAAANEAVGASASADARWSVVEPAAGRAVAFTSGKENVHRVEPVTRGTRLALTMAFTCNEAKAASVERWEGGPGSGYEEGY